MWPLYAAGFTAVFGTHAVAANLGGFSDDVVKSLLTLELLLALYDGAEVLLKPVLGTIADRIGARPVLAGRIPAAVRGDAGLGVVVAGWALLAVPAVPPLPRTRQTVINLARRVTDPLFLRPTAALAGAVQHRATLESGARVVGSGQHDRVGLVNGATQFHRWA